MMRVLFIHGTMTRYGEDYLRTFDLIERRLHGWQGTTEVAKFPWGEYWGAELNPAFVSIPGAEERGEDEVLGAAPEDEGAPSEAERWAQLYADPLAELRQLLAGQAGAAAPETPDGRALRQAARQLDEGGPHADLAALLAEGQITGTFPAAAAWAAALFQQGELGPALLALPAERAEVARLAMARGIVAAALAAAYRAGAYPEGLLDAGLRERLVTEVEYALGGGAVLGGAADWLTFLPATAATRLLLRPLRVDLNRSLLQFVGDILVYQAKGTAIRGAIEAQLGEGPTVLLAHSLGGIACAELLLTSAAARRAVPLLITVGSQVGVLHEIGALVTQRAADDGPSQLPVDFPPWLNICDRNDLLSFLVAPRFAGRVRDVELDSANPFPHAHNAYWRNDQVWDEVMAAIDEPGNIQLQLR